MSRVYRCHRCGWTSRAYAPMERHVDTHGGGRIEIVPGEEQTDGG